MANLNILSQRYVTPAMNNIFSELGKSKLERKLWLTVLKAQKELGVDINPEDIQKYEAAIDDIDLDKIEEIEKVTKHDIKAKIEGYNLAAGVKKGSIHRGMTSRDLTDNVEQAQLKQASELIFGKYTSILRHLCEKSQEYENILLTARTHHQPAQITTMGRRFAEWLEELTPYVSEFRKLIDNSLLRGIKGAVGTQVDMLKVLGSREKVDALEKKVSESLGFEYTLVSPGQVYGRSRDFQLLSHLALLAAPCENYALNMRLMAGYELVTEGFKKGQAGSSAMPHKMNTRSSERVCGFSTLLKMYANGASLNSGNQWEEGDVSCSVVRRVILPDAFYTSDGLCETTLTVLNNMGVYEKVCDAELQKYLPFLATTQILMEAVDKGMGREEAHKVIKEYAIRAALDMREGKPQQLVETLAQDPLFVEHNFTLEEMQNLLVDPLPFIGLAKEQANLARVRAINVWGKYPIQSQYEPGDIL